MKYTLIVNLIIIILDPHSVRVYENQTCVNGKEVNGKKKKKKQIERTKFNHFIINTIRHIRTETIN